MTYVDEFLAGNATLEDIDDYVDQWHNGNSEVSLHEFLGFTWDEYVVWGTNPSLLSTILESKKSMYKR